MSFLKIYILMVFSQNEKCQNDGVARPPIRDNDLKLTEANHPTKKYCWTPKARHQN